MTGGRLTPNAIAKRLFVIDPDRDERASQLCIETLATIASNSYGESDGFVSPKLRRFALRSLVLERNFLVGNGEPLSRGDLTSHQYGEMLQAGEDFQGADNLALARTALKNLIDPSTETGQPGQHLMLPFHESLLWYDARRSGTEFSVRKVRMRGSGITLARMLLDPPPDAGEEAIADADDAIRGLRQALTAESPLSELADSLEAVLPAGATDTPAVQDDELESWTLGADASLVPLVRDLCRHASGIVTQGSASAAAMLWQLRSILALDLATNTLRRAWDALQTEPANRRLLLAIAGPNRQADRVRLRSERSYSDARTAIRWATVGTIAGRMEELDRLDGVDWAAEFEGRTARLLQDSVVEPLNSPGEKSFRTLAELAFENANYDRAGNGFRVLVESIGMSAGGTAFRYLSATPDLLAALVGALAAEMPMTSAEFFRRVGEEWGLVMSNDAATGTIIASEVDGADLAVNGRRFERLLIDAGLATGLSDRTVLVGERAGRRER